RFAVPALMAGNAGILKHASNVPRCALEIERLFRAAGLLEGLFGAVLVGPAAVPSLIADARVRAVTLTGSERAGSQVAERAGRELKKTVLELGGSDPFVVLEDADLPRAARTAAAARLVNSGQSCIAAKRFIVVEEAARRGGRASPGERLGLRARRVPVDREPGACRAPRAARRGRLRVRERARQVGPAPSLRRHQALGLRARALGVRHPRVREREERLDGVGGS